MRRWTILLLAVTLACLVARAFAGAGGGRHESLGRPTNSPLTDFARHLRVGEGVRYQHLTIFPVTVTGVRVPDVTLTLDLAGAKGLIEVAELRDSEVNRLGLRNRAKEPVFIMAGEMVRGGKQDRIMADDVVIAPGDALTVAVYCVEHGRWVEGGGGGRFSTGHSLAGSGARGGGMGGGGGRAAQSAVWDAVARQQRALKAPSQTGALRSVHDSESVRKQIAPYLKAFAHFPEDNRKASGIIAVADDEILAADLFSSPVLLRESWPQLLEAYAIDAVEHGEEHPATRRHHGPQQGDVQHWLDGLASAHRVERSTPGEGELYDLRGDSLRGSALVWDRGVVHMGLFPSEEETPQELEYNPLQFRRDRMQTR